MCAHCSPVHEETLLKGSRLTPFTVAGPPGHAGSSKTPGNTLSRFLVPQRSGKAVRSVFFHIWELHPTIASPETDTIPRGMALLCGRPGLKRVSYIPYGCRAYPSLACVRKKRTYQS